MIQLFGIARLGKDAELRNAGDSSVCNLALAFSYGRKGDDGYKPTQWVDATLWNKQAEALAQYLTKGKMLCVTIDDVHIETYQSAKGEGTKLVGRISNLDFAGDSKPASQPPSAPAQRQSAPVQQQRPAHNFSDMDDDIPF